MTPICPFRVHGERTASLTVAGEYYYNETFMPCLKEGCPVFSQDCGDMYCYRNDTPIILHKAQEEQNEKTQNDQVNIGWIGTTDPDPV